MGTLYRHDARGAVSYTHREVGLGVGHCLFRVYAISHAHLAEVEHILVVGTALKLVAPRVE